MHCTCGHPRRGTVLLSNTDVEQTSHQLNPDMSRMKRSTVSQIFCRSMLALQGSQDSSQDNYHNKQQNLGNSGKNCVPHTLALCSQLMVVANGKYR